MDTRYSVMFTGELCPGFNFDEVLINFVTLTKMEAEKAKKFLSSTKPVLIRKGVDRETAEKYQSGLTKAGLNIELVDSDTRPDARRNAHQTSASAMASDNPYAAPKADLQVEKKGGYGDWLEQPRKVPAFNGGRWIKDAAALFFASAWKWMGIFITFVLLTIPFHFIPFIGGVINTFLAILLGAGVLMGAHEVAEGGDLSFGHLFQGFKQNTVQLLLIGLIYLAFCILTGILASIFIGGPMALLSLAGGNPTGIAMAIHNSPGMFWIVFLVLLSVACLFFMGYYFATPLVALSDRKATAAYMLSFKGCGKNWLPFLVYFLVFLSLGFLIMFGFMLFSGIFGGIFGGHGSMIFAFLPLILMALIGLPLGIITALTAYTSFRDIFYRSA